MFASYEKLPILRIFDILLNLAGLTASIVYYYNHQGSPIAFLGLGLMAGFLILSFIFKIIGYLFRFGLILVLLALGYFIFIKHEKPKDLHKHMSLATTRVFLNDKNHS
jgi:hypothetical protein